MKTSLLDCEPIVQSSDNVVSTSPHIDRLLLVCGAMKAGTTWLFSVLRQHPLIATPIIKEIHFFSPATLPWVPLSDASRIQTMARYFANHGPYAKSAPELAAAARADLEWFHRYLADPVDLDWFRRLFDEDRPDRYFTDFSPFTSLGQQADLERIRAYSRQRRLIYLLRSPLARYWSHYNFHKSLFSPEEDISAHCESRYAAELADDNFAIHGHFARFIFNVRNVFAPDELLVLPIEDCRADPLGILRKIEIFLDLPAWIYDPSSLQDSVFPSRVIEIPLAFVRACDPLVKRDCKELDNLGILYPDHYRGALA